MQVRGFERLYAAGDCVNFNGPKMGHMAVRQGEVAAENILAEIQGKKVTTRYDHEMMLVIDAGGDASTFVHKNLWDEEQANIRHSRFWTWAKRKQERRWISSHS
jgi:sulfide:quinone oxidoreductase